MKRAKVAFLLAESCIQVSSFLVQRMRSHGNLWKSDVCVSGRYAGILESRGFYF